MILTWNTGDLNNETAASDYSLVAPQTYGSNQQWDVAEDRIVTSNPSNAQGKWDHTISSNDWAMIMGVMVKAS